MIYLSKHEISNPCFKSFFNRWYWAAISIALLFGLLIAIYVSKKSPIMNSVLMFAAGAFCIIMFIKRINGAAGIANTMIDTIEITSDQVILTTYDMSLYFGLYNRESYEIACDRQKVRLEPYPEGEQFTLIKESAGTIYLLKCDIDQYLICEGFFDRFDEIRLVLGDK